MSIPTEETIVQVAGPKPPVQRLKDLLKDPKYLRIIVIILAVIVVILLCALIANAFLGGGTTPTPTPTPIIKFSPTVTPIPTEPLSEKEARLKKCFQECNAKEFLNTLRDELVNVKSYKYAIEKQDLRTNSCTGNYGEVLLPDREFISSFQSSGCNKFYFKPDASQIKIGSNLYTFANGAWDKGSVTPRAQSHMLDLLGKVQKQEEVKSTKEIRGDQGDVMVLSAETKIVNEFNKLVDYSIQIKVTSKYQVVYFREFEDTNFNINGRFFDFDVPVDINPPG